MKISVRFIKMTRGRGCKAFFIAGLVLCLMTQSLWAKGTIRGRVFDKNTKDPLSYANIMIKGTTIGTAADADGMYSITNAPDGPQTIVISYIASEMS